MPCDTLVRRLNSMRYGETSHVVLSLVMVNPASYTRKSRVWSPVFLHLQGIVIADEQDDGEGVPPPPEGIPPPDGLSDDDDDDDESDKGAAFTYSTRR